MRRTTGWLALLFLAGAPGLWPAIAAAQVYETDFDDLEGWEAVWPGDEWRVARGHAAPRTDATCAEALGADYADDPGCAFGGMPEPHDNLLVAGDDGWSDYRLWVRFVSFDDDAVGFVVRYADPDNYYLFLQSRGTWPTAATPSADARGVTSRLYRVRDGRAALLASADRAFTPGRAHAVRIDVVEARIAVYFDADGDGRLGLEDRLFEVEDPTPLRRGRIGLWAYDNGNFYVDRLRVVTAKALLTPVRFQVRWVTRDGRKIGYRFELPRNGEGYLRAAIGRCADVDPIQRQREGGRGRIIEGLLRTAPDTDYCVRACGLDDNGEGCTDEIDLSTRGAVIDTRALSPGHWDLVTSDGREHLGARRLGTRVETTARFGSYRLRIAGRELPFDVDRRGHVVLGDETLGGRAVVLDGALALAGLPVVLDSRRQRGDARWALFAGDYAAGFGAYVGREARSFSLLPGRYLWRVRGRDLPFDLQPDGQVSVPPASEGALVATGRNVLRADFALQGEPVAFRVRVVNASDRAWLGGGVLNARGARPGDDVFFVFPGLRAYALADAKAGHFRNLADALGLRIDGHARYGFDRLAPGAAHAFTVLVWPDNPRLAFVADIEGEQDDVVAAGAPFEATLFDDAGEPTEGRQDLYAHDTDAGDGDRRGYVSAGRGPVGTLQWTVQARVSTPGPVAVHWINRAGTRARVSFRADRSANGAVQYVAAPCDETDWRNAREVALGNGTAFGGEIDLVPQRRYCLRARAFNAAGSRFGPPQTLSTIDLTVDATALPGSYRIQVPGPNNVHVVQAGSVRDDLNLRMGTYLVDQGGDALRVQVDKDGRVTYDAALEGLLEGAGTDRLVLAGRPVRVDASTVSGVIPLWGGRGDASALPLGALAGGAAHAIRLLPGDFWIVHGERHAFAVDRAGAVASDDAAALQSGDGQLTLRGRAITLDLTPVPGRVTLAAAPGDPAHHTIQAGAGHVVGLLPGRYSLVVDGTRSLLRVAADDAPRVAEVADPLAFRSCLDSGDFARAEGVGTDTLVVRADPCAVTAEVFCEQFCGDGPQVFQARDGIGEMRAVVRYASGQPLRNDEIVPVAFEVTGGALAADEVATVDGVATVGYTAPDRRGDYLLRVRAGDLAASRAFVVIPVRDLRPPEIRPGGRVTAEQAGPDGTRLRLEAPQVTDDRDPAPVVESDAPAIFPLGRTVVTWRARDFSGNVALATQEVVITDTTPPILRVPEVVEVEAEEAAGTRIRFGDVQAEDVCDAFPEITRDGPARFPVGETRVTWTATDDSGNRTQATTLVRVLDRSPPRMVFGGDEIVLEQTHLDGARGVDLPLPAVVDNGDPEPAVTHNAPAVLPLGRTPVTFFARDASGNQSRARVNVRVVDTTAPRVTVRGAPQGWVREARFEIEVFDICDLRPDLLLEPQPDAATRDDNVHSVAYGAEGTFDVAVQALDDSGNRAARVLRTFGIDRTPPRIRIVSRLGEADPDDEGSWPVVDRGERLALRVDAADAGADRTSGLAHVRVVLDPGSVDEAVLVDARPVAEGAALPAGPRALRGLTCVNAALCTGDGALVGREVGSGSHIIEVTATDLAGNTTVERRHFRVFDLRAALLAAMDAVIGLSEGGGIANEGVAALDEAADRLAVAADLATGQPAGPEAPLDLTGHVIRQVQRVSPALRRAARFGADVAAVERIYVEALYWAVAEYGRVGLDPEPAVAEDHQLAVEVFLADAREQIDRDRLENALASLADAYFLFANAFRPLTASTLGDAGDAIAMVEAEMSGYVTVPTRPGVALLQPALAELRAAREDIDAYVEAVGDAEDPAIVIQRLGAVDSREFLETLLVLRSAALRMQSADQADVWISNWGWGLVQTVRLLGDLGLRRSVAVFPPMDVPDVMLVDETRALIDDAGELIERRRIDRFLELFLRPRTGCLMVLVHNRAFDPDWPRPQGCR